MMMRTQTVWHAKENPILFVENYEEKKNPKYKIAAKVELFLIIVLVLVVDVVVVV